MKTKNIYATIVFAGWLACCAHLRGDPLNNWHWRNPLPSGNPAIGSNALWGVCFTNGIFFGAGDWGTIATSTDGRYWTENSSATTNQLSDIIYGGGQFVAVGNNGAVETSPDGTNWVLQNSSTTVGLTSVAYGNGTYCAVGPSILITSPDGVTWSKVVSGLQGATGIAGSSYGFVAVNGTTQAFFSSNGRIWSTNSLPITELGYSGEQLQAQIVTYWNGLFLAGGTAAQGGSLEYFYVLASPDGVNWPTNVYTDTAGFTIINQYYFFMTANSNVVAYGLASGFGFLQYSSDGLHWQSQTSGVSEQGTGGAYGNGTYVMAGGYPVATKYYGVYVSTDLVNWAYEPYSSSLPVGPASTFNNITYGNGMYVVATSDSIVVSTNDADYNIESNTPSLSSVTTFEETFFGVGPNGIYESANGASWIPMIAVTTNELHSVAAGSNLVVAVGNNGTIQTFAPPPAPFTWVIRSSGTTQALNGVVYSNGLYVAVGQQGTVVTSPDGITWTVRNSGVVSNLLGVTYGPAGFLAVGVNGTILTSLDGTNWTQQNSGTSATLETATAGSGYYLVAGAYGTVLSSIDGVNWSPRNVGATGSQTFYGSGFLNGRFDVVGTHGNILESDAVPQIFNLEFEAVPPRDIVTAFVPPGSTFRIQSNTNLLNSSAWTTAATFNDASAITYWTNSLGGFNFYRLVSP